MREDMFKVIVERPRRTRGKSTKTKLRYFRDDRSRMSGRRMACELNDRKWLNENLAPLKRYLFTQRGRKWDDVFSEICQHIDTGSTVKMHVREHLDDFIVRNIMISDDGMYCDMDSPQYQRRADSWWKELYVCPIDGRIKETQALLASFGLKTQRQIYRRKRKQRARNRTYKNSFRRLSDTEFLVICDGIWYRYETTAPPVTMNGYPLSDGVIRHDLRTYKSIVHPKWALKSKKQLSKKGLKKHGLKNAPNNGGDNV